MLSDTLKHRRAVSHNYRVKRQRMRETCCFFACGCVSFGPFVSCNLNANISLAQRSFMHQRVLRGRGLPAGFKRLVAFWCRFFLVPGKRRLVTATFLLYTRWVRSTDLLPITAARFPGAAARLDAARTWTIFRLCPCLYTRPPPFFSVRAIIALMHMANKRLAEKSQSLPPKMCWLRSAIKQQEETLRQVRRRIITRPCTPRGSRSGFA